MRATPALLLPALVGALAMACGGQVHDNGSERADLVLNRSVAANGGNSSQSAELAPQSSEPQSSDPQPAAQQGSPLPVTEQGGMASVATASVPDTDAALDEPQEEGPATIKTFEKQAARVVEDACRVWLDVEDSALAPDDISVSFSGTSWPATQPCVADVGWNLQRDDEGTWLVACPMACDVMASEDQGILEIQATYWSAEQQVVTR